MEVSWCQHLHLNSIVATGSGKTALLEELAHRTGNVDYITIHVDDQMDSKALLGAYVATTTPGEFTWQPGLLTQVELNSRLSRYT